ncbi:MAG: hypothetical protein IT450_13775 [Phycisphaerales bacterium]|nr:hypothetical protein [Phycisphaerales bacterium]
MISFHKIHSQSLSVHAQETRSSDSVQKTIERAIRIDNNRALAFTTCEATMNRRSWETWAAILLCQSALASITVQVDKLGASDGIPMPPANLVVIDIAAEPSSNDAFSGIGCWARTANGARLEYAHDPNGVVPTAPGTENRFVTFFSRPRGRDADARFGSGAVLAVAGRYSGGVVPIFEPFLADAALFDSPGSPPGQPGPAGWVGRFVLDLSSATDPRFQSDSPAIVIAETPPVNSIPLLEFSAPAGIPGLYVWSENNASTELNFGVYGIIPEPATTTCLLIFGSVLLRRR